MSLRDRLDCLVDFVEMTLLAVLLLLPPCLPASRPPAAPFRQRLPSPSPNCFFRVCFPKHFANVLKDFLPLITSPISGAANSNKSAPMRSAAGKYIFTQKWNGSSPNNLCKCAESPTTLSTNTSIVWNLYLS